MINVEVVHEGYFNPWKNQRKKEKNDKINPFNASIDFIKKNKKASIDWFLLKL